MILKNLEINFNKWDLINNKEMKNIKDNYLLQNKINFRERISINLKRGFILIENFKQLKLIQIFQKLKKKKV